MNRVLVIGSSNMDLIAVVPDLPQAGETVIASEFHKKYGGKGANQAVAARKAGAEVILVTGLGSDGYGSELKSHYERLGIDVSHIRELDAPTGMALINVSATSSENSISVISGANDLLSQDMAREALELPADMIVLQNEAPDNTIRSVINGKPIGRQLLYNPAPYRFIEGIDWGRIDILVVNEIEHKQLESIVREESVSLDVVPNIVVTRGANGCDYVSKGSTHHLPVYKADVVDTTGAGDTFCGYLAAIWSESGDPENAIRESMAAAAIAIGRVGAQEAMPTRQQVLTYLANR